MGCGFKILIAALVFGVLLIIGVCAGGYFLFQKIQEGATTEPAKVREISQSIVEVDVPNQLPPAFAIDLSMMGNSFSMAIYADQIGGSMWVMSVPTPYEPDKARVEDVLRQMEQQQQHKPPEQKQKVIRIDKSEKIERQVNGRIAKFLVASGKDELGVPHTQVTGIFESATGSLGMFNLVIAEAEMDMDAGRKMVESVE